MSRELLCLRILFGLMLTGFYNFFFKWEAALQRAPSAQFCFALHDVEPMVFCLRARGRRRRREKRRAERSSNAMIFHWNLPPSKSKLCALCTAFTAMIDYSSDCIWKRRGEKRRGVGWLSILFSYSIERERETGLWARLNGRELTYLLHVTFLFDRDIVYDIVTIRPSVRPSVPPLRFFFLVSQ